MILISPSYPPSNVKQISLACTTNIQLDLPRFFRSNLPSHLLLFLFLPILHPYPSPSPLSLSCYTITATIVSHNVPPYGRAGLYKELSVMKDLLADLRTTFYSPSSSIDLAPFRSVIPLIADAAEKSGTQLSCAIVI